MFGGRLVNELAGYMSGTWPYDRNIDCLLQHFLLGWDDHTRLNAGQNQQINSVSSVKIP